MIKIHVIRGYGGSLGGNSITNPGWRSLEDITLDRDLGLTMGEAYDPLYVSAYDMVLEDMDTGFLYQYDDEWFTVPLSEALVDLFPSLNVVTLTDAPAADAVNPSHYKDLDPEPIDVLFGAQLPYPLDNVVKYLVRYKTKNGVEDLRKAHKYLTYAMGNGLQMPASHARGNIGHFRKALDAWGIEDWTQYAAIILTVHGDFNKALAAVDDLIARYN